MQSLTFKQLYDLPVVVDLMTAARVLGIGRTKAYRLAHDGQFPVRLIRPGLSYLVPTADLLRLLGITPPEAGTVMTTGVHTTTPREPGG